MFNKNKIRRFLSLFILIFIVFGFVIFVCEEADARAGGGHSYSGGGGSHGGGGGGGAALVKLIYYLIRLNIECPQIGIPLTIVLVGCFIYAYKTGDDAYVGHTIRKANTIYPDVSGKLALSKIKAKDPGFDEAGFQSRAQKAFYNIQNGWCSQNLDKVQAFLADGTYEQFLIQINIMKEMHLKDVMENTKVTSTSIVNFESHGIFDVIHLAITASAKNYRVDSRTDKFVEGDRYENEFTEIWTFLRRTGAKTLGKPGLIEGFCPNCGAPLSMGRHAKCQSCGSILRSGEHDWVLSNITQAEEWTGKSNRNIPGLKGFMQLDAGFNIQHIEDRISVMFWRKNEAERIGNIAPLRKIASDDFCNAQSRWYKPDSSGSRKFYTDCAVGVIQILAVDTVTSDKDDYVYAKVIWSGVPAKKSSNGSISAVVNKLNFKNIFVLRRKHGVKTDMNSSLSSSHCPCCGAPESKAVSYECEYCGSVLNDGSREWVLEAVLEQTDPMVTRALTLVKDNESKNNVSGNNLNSQAQNGIKKKYTYGQAMQDMNNWSSDVPISSANLIKWTVAMMLADGVIDDRELAIIHEYALRRGVNRNKCDAIIEEIKAQTMPMEYVAQSTDLPVDEELLRILIRIAYADGKITSEELNMLKYVGRKMNMNEVSMRNMLREERDRMYYMSKAVIKGSKNL